MATHHPSPPAGMQMHHGPPSGPPQPGMPPQQQWPASQQMAAMNEAVWLQIGSLAEMMGNLDEAKLAYENALRSNARSIPAMNAISCILRTQEHFHQAVEYLQNILKLDNNNGDVWGSLGHCYLMMDDLQQAYSAYQQALYHLRDPKEPKLWYGIGILYDRYGSLEHAEEAFSQVMRMQPDFEKANEIYFRLGIIYKQQQKYQQSLECFRYIVSVPPTPLTEEDIWFQIGHVHEQQKDVSKFPTTLCATSDATKIEIQIMQKSSSSLAGCITNRATASAAKNKRLNQSDAQSWYLLGRCYMSQQKYPKAYEAYQQAVYRDGRNPTFWCSIGVLYYQINQYRDALDAYSRAIRLNPYISEVWYDLGTLYESCNNQITDALDAYQRAAELDPTNVHIKARLQLLRSGQSNGMPVQTSAPLPQDVHPQAYQATGAVGPPGPQWGTAASQPPPPGPPIGPSGNWGGRLAEINPPPQPPNPYDQREPPRGPIPPPPRAPSPRQDQQMRAYNGPDNRPPPPPPRRSPPREHHAAMGPYPGPGLPQPPPPQSQGPPPSQPPQRVSNPNYAGPGASTPLPPTQNGMNGSAPGALPPFGRGNSPRPEVRPIMDNRIPSPKSGYPHQYHHPDISNPGGIEGGAPPPASALVAAEAAAEARNSDRPTSAGPKRMREWEDEPSMKKPASDENRARMDDMHHRRPSTPLGEPFRRSSSEARRADERRIEEQRRADDQRRSDDLRRSEDQRRAEDLRRANENYHPSEAAHHPPTHGPPPAHLPSMQQGPGPVHTPLHTPIHELPPPPSKEYVPEEQREREQLLQPPPPPAPVSEPERAARKMDVDEDYDDDGDEEKKGAIVSGPGSAAGDAKTSSPNGVHSHANGLPNGQPKVETSA
ncbi:General transcriptional corepressor ssn6 [Hyphodiscus hymeniophilus]|uniref:General transcriptional corepressor ssn6 n=1 Tax=Hyphodiscus hymeniophilus TaxID=353542 RepID=A0A9P6VRH0_9HELO|nr:General transcriptional corepressor ssn6 [Hyphodiscus hymeniophilus]